MASYSVVVDQLVGLHFVLCSDGPLALSLQPADVTSRMARTLKDGHQVDRQIMQAIENTLAFLFYPNVLLWETHMCAQILLWAVQDTQSVVKMDFLVNSGMDLHTNVHWYVQHLELQVHMKDLQQKNKN